MNILISGATGFVGKELIKALLRNGHEIDILSRRESTQIPGCKTIVWKSIYDEFTTDKTHYSVVINLLGENIAQGRWTNARKKQLYNSRIDGTQNLINNLKRQNVTIGNFIQASAIGYYGNDTNIVADESSNSGNDFMAKLCEDWEQVAHKNESAFNTYSIFRIGVVLGKDGGAMAKMLPVFKLGLGGKLGSGKQHMSWIHLDDLVSIFVEACEKPGSFEVVNCVAPYPVTNKEFTKCLGEVLRKKTPFAVPSLVLNIALGEMKTVVLDGPLINSKVLKEKKFFFKYPTLEKALKEVISK